MSFVYRAMWEIEDEDRTRSALVAEASGALDTMARHDGARLVGDVSWTVAGNRLVAEASAVPADAKPGSDDDLRRLVELKWSDGQIGAVMGRSASWVCKRRKALGIPANHRPFGGAA